MTPTSDRSAATSPGRAPTTGSASAEQTPGWDAAAILDALPERVVRYRVSDLTITYCNEAWSALHGVRRDDALGRPLDGFLSTTGLAGLERQLELLGPDRPVLTDSEARSALNDPDLWLEFVDRYLEGPDGPEVLSVGRDVTDRRDAELQRDESEAGFRDLADNSCDIVWRIVLHPVQRFDYMSPSVERIAGYPPSFFLGGLDQLRDVTDDDGRRAIAASLRDGHELDTFDMKVNRPDGSTVICETRASRIGDIVQGITRDVTELRCLRDRLEILASHDPMTQLPNRRHLAELLDQALARIRATEQHLEVAYVDLDGLKEVNDTHGHAAGDALLCGVAESLLAMAQPDDIVARVGGDEFVVVSTTEPNDRTSLHARIAQALKRAVDVDGTVAVVPRASIGIADTQRSGNSPNDLIAAADQAMYSAKRERRRTRAASDAA